MARHRAGSNGRVKPGDYITVWARGGKINFGADGMKWGRLVNF
jgi:hypothetical protein